MYGKVRILQSVHLWATDTPVWTSRDICPGSFTCMASLPAYNGFLEFTSGVTPADALVASMASEPQCATDALPTEHEAHSLQTTKGLE